MKKTFLMLVAFFAFMSISAQNKAEKNLPEVDGPSAGGGCVCRLSDEADGHRGAGRGGWE